MSKYKGEKVLVVPRELFDKVGSFHGVKYGADNYLETFLAPGNAFFMDREEAEQDPSHKQLIPYAIFTFQGKILHYTRGGSGGEARLHDKGSIGIGGHINPVDWQGAEQGMSTYLAGVERETREELDIADPYTQTAIGLINDDTNEVGAVHLGVIHEFKLTSDRVSSNEDAIARLTFYTLEELKEQTLFNKLETWSQLCLLALEEGRKQ